MKRPSLWQTARADLLLVPGVLTALFCVSVVIMNLLANKIVFETDWIAADGGILVSWVAFLSMDIVTKAFGKRAATTLSFFALLFWLLPFFSLSLLPCPYLSTPPPYYTTRAPACGVKLEFPPRLLYPLIFLKYWGEYLPQG